MPKYNESIRKPFSDLKNLAIGTVLSAIPIANWAATGYILESSGVGKSKPSYSLNEWGDWGELFIKGILSTVISFIYVLPAILVMLLGIGGAAISTISANPEIKASLLAGGPMALQKTGMAFMSAMTLANIGLMATAIVAGGLLMLIASYVTPMAVLTYIRTGSIGAAFRLGDVFGKAFSWTYLTVWLVSLFVSFLVMLVLGFIPFIGGPAASFISGIFTYTLFGEVYRQLEGAKA